MPASYGHPLQAWASSFGFGRRTGIDVGPEAGGLLPTPEWRQRTFTAKTDPCCWRLDSLWKPGDSIQLAIGQKDLLVTPLQMARFYALIANGGKLVTPHLLLSVDQSITGGAAPHPAAPAAQQINIDPGALDVVRQGLLKATHDPLGTSSAVFGGFPVPIAGKTGTAEKAVDPGDGVARLFNQSWWCGYGPVRRSEARRLRADRERRPRRHRRSADGTEGVRAVLPPEGAVDRRDPQRLMAIDYSSSPTERARGRARRAAARGGRLVPAPARLAAARRRRRARRVRPLGDQRHHAPRRRRQPALLPDAAGRVRRRRRRRVRARARPIDPGRLQRYWRPIYISTVAVMLLVFLAGPVTRGSQRWLDIGPFRFQPSEFGKLFFVLAHRRVPRRARQEDQRPAHDAQRDRARRSADHARVHAAGLRHRARLRRRARRRALHRRHALADDGVPRREPCSSARC